MNSKNKLFSLNKIKDFSILNNQFVFSHSIEQEAINKIIKIITEKFTQKQSFNSENKIFISFSKTIKTNNLIEYFSKQFEKYFLKLEIILNNESFSIEEHKNLSKEIKPLFSLSIKKNIFNDKFIISIFDSNSLEIEIIENNIYEKNIEIACNQNFKNDSIKNNNLHLIVSNQNDFMFLKRNNFILNNIEKQLHFKHKQKYKIDAPLSFSMIEKNTINSLKILKGRKENNNFLLSVIDLNIFFLYYKNNFQRKNLDLDKIITLILNYLYVTNKLQNYKFDFGPLTSKTIQIFFKSINKLTNENSISKAEKISFYFDGFNKLKIGNCESLNLLLQIDLVNKMINFYSKKKLDFLEVWKAINKKTGNYFFNIEQFDTDKISFDLLIKNLEQNPQISNNKLLRIFDSDFKDNFIYKKYLFENNQSYSVYANKNEESSFYVLSEFIYKNDVRKKSNIDDLFPKLVSAKIKDNIPENTDVKFRPSLIIKYAFLIAIIVGLIAIVINTFYRGTNSSNIIYNAIELARKIPSYFIFYLWASTLTFIITQGLLRYRLLKQLKVKNLKYRYFFLSAWMSMLVSFVTPLQIGGDIFGFWFLRRKGIKSSQLASTFLSSTLIYQIALFLNIIIFSAFGHEFYFLLYKESIYAFSFFVTGLILTILIIILIFTLVLSSRIQNFIVKKVIYFTNIIPLFNYQNQQYHSIKWKYNFLILRKYIFEIWKKPLLLTELIIYEIGPRFFSGIAIANMMMGIVKPFESINPYLLQIVANNVVYTANSFSITPGGSGTQEILNILVNSLVFNGADSIEANRLAALSDFINKLTNIWPFLIISLGFIITVVIGEKRIQQIWKINHKIRITNSSSPIKKTWYYYYASAIWIVILSLIICGYIFLI